jgi:broad-specificity NMP kinase
MHINEEIHPAQQQFALAKAIALIRRIGNNEYVDTRNRAARNTAARVIKIIDSELADETIVRKSWSI